LGEITLIGKKSGVISNYPDKQASCSKGLQEHEGYAPCIADFSCIPVERTPIDSGKDAFTASMITFPTYLQKCNSLEILFSGISCCVVC
jgi:hypothetical protein